jgi:antitoxin ParD1/3/4
VTEQNREFIRMDQKEVSRDKIEAEVLEGLLSGESTPMTQEDWDRFREELRRRQEKR